MLNKYFLILVVSFITHVVADGQGNIYKTNTGTISFKSEAPLEVITATSRKMEGAINADELTFAFTLQVRSFEGFNNGLQQQHFYENYLETDKYPTATFSGKIIEHVNLKIPGTYTIRAKGQLTIHGRSRSALSKRKLFLPGINSRLKHPSLFPSLITKLKCLVLSIKK